MAQIPRLATVNKAEAAGVKVSSQGEPQFQPIENMQLSYGANTDNKVIKVRDLYYLCFQGVWFMSRGANGPCETGADILPDATAYGTGYRGPIIRATKVA